MGVCDTHTQALASDAQPLRPVSSSVGRICNSPVRHRLYVIKLCVCVMIIVWACGCSC